jgi:hypothetical protein
MNGYEGDEHNPVGDLIALGVGVGAVIVTGVTAWKRRQRQRRIKGRMLLVCGRPSAGKTTLCTFLAEGRLPTRTEQTRYTETYTPQRHFPLPGGGWIKTIVEPPSRLNDTIAEWKRQLPDAGRVFYVFRADKVLNSEPLELRQIEIDAEILADFLKAQPPMLDDSSSGEATPAGVLLVGTHSDYVAGGNLTTNDEVADRVACNPSIRLARMHLGGLSRAHLVVGSLVDEEAAGLLASKVVDKVVGK